MSKIRQFSCDANFFFDYRDIRQFYVIKDREGLKGLRLLFSNGREHIVNDALRACVIVRKLNEFGALTSETAYNIMREPGPPYESD